MKRAILIFCFTIVTGCMVYLNKPTDAVGANNSIPKYSASFTVECPVSQAKSPPIFEPEYPYTVTDSSDYHYDHCASCNTGVFLPSKEGVVRCTYCGKSKEPNSTQN